jgi:hypothetical protein
MEYGTIMTLDATVQFISGRQWVQIVAQRPAILTEVPHGLPESLQEMLHYGLSFWHVLVASVLNLSTMPWRHIGGVEV